MSQYALIDASDDGTRFRILTDAELGELLNNPTDWGVERFVTPATRENEDPNYWPDGDAMLVKFDVVEPRPVTSAWSLP